MTSQFSDHDVSHCGIAGDFSGNPKSLTNSPGGIIPFAERNRPRITTTPITLPLLTNRCSIKLHLSSQPSILVCTSNASKSLSSRRNLPQVSPTIGSAFALIATRYAPLRRTKSMRPTSASVKYRPLVTCRLKSRSSGHTRIRMTVDSSPCAGLRQGRRSSMRRSRNQRFIITPIVECSVHSKDLGLG